MISSPEAGLISRMISATAAALIIRAASARIGVVSGIAASSPTIAALTTRRRYPPRRGPVVSVALAGRAPAALRRPGQTGHALVPPVSLGYGGDPQHTR